MDQAEAAAGNALLLSQYQATTDAEEVDLRLIESLLLFVSGEAKPGSNDKQSDSTVDGAVLVFLPGRKPPRFNNALLLKLCRFAFHCIIWKASSILVSDLFLKIRLKLLLCQKGLHIFTSLG